MANFSPLTLASIARRLTHENDGLSVPIACGLRDPCGAVRRALGADQSAGAGFGRGCRRDTDGHAGGDAADADADAERSMTTSEDLHEYFREADSWDADRSAGFRRSAAIAWWVAAAGWLCAVACALGVAVLTPLKQIEPFVVRVDNSTGIVDVVPVSTGSSAPE